MQIDGELGLRTQYGDGGFYGYAQVGEGVEMLGILGYLDMVPPGKLKDYERLPFDPVEREGLLFIRSTQDENVPLLAYLFGVTTPHA